MLAKTPRPGRRSLTAIVVTWMIASTISGCQKEAVQKNAQHQEGLLATKAKATANGAETREGLFGPVAATFGCLGYNVNFTPAQTVVLKETITTDGKGVLHYTRHWSVEGLTARATLPGGAPYLVNGLPVTFTVVSGQEMFSIKNPNTTTGVPSPASSGEVFMHQGTIVLQSTQTGDRIVIRHVIIKNPGQGVLKDSWYVQGQACS